MSARRPNLALMPDSLTQTPAATKVTASAPLIDARSLAFRVVGAGGEVNIVGGVNL